MKKCLLAYIEESKLVAVIKSVFTIKFGTSFCDGLCFIHVSVKHLTVFMELTRKQSLEYTGDH